MKRFYLILIFLVLGTVAVSAQDKLYEDEFPLGDVTLLDGPLKKARDLNVENLLKYDVDRMLAPYRKEAGLPKKAECYPNWDGLDGHVGGHYLSALAINASTGSKECRERMEYMISELWHCAAANAETSWGKGYVGGVPGSARIWTDFREGNFDAFFAAWVPFYNIHKMYGGLRDAWLYCGDERARRLFLDFCDWIIDLTAPLDKDQMARILDVEHGGINEVLADAYEMTGEKIYLEAAKRFSHKRVMVPLSCAQDSLDNLHANTQVPKAIGFARIGELGGGENYLRAGSFFWDTVTEHRSLAFGGNSRAEHFPSAEDCRDFTTAIDGPESCNTHNMLKLTEDLHRMSPEARYADYYELAVFNHILSTQHPEHGGYVYFTPARPRHYRNYSAANEAMWCCVGTGMENHGKYGQFIYTHRGDSLYVNLFVSSRLDWKQKGLVLRQDTAFPYGETSTITVEQGDGNFALALRFPSWARVKEFSVKVNGRRVKFHSGPSSYVFVRRNWRKGDVVTVSFPMHVSIEAMPNVPDYVAFKYGPVLLGMKTGTEDMQHLVADDSRFGQYASGEKLPLEEAPVLLVREQSVVGVVNGVETSSSVVGSVNGVETSSSVVGALNGVETSSSEVGALNGVETSSSVVGALPSSIVEYIVPVEGKPLHFLLKAPMLNPIEGELQPFFEIHDSRYMIYWPWKSR